jgi:2-iminoacetate synthase ThiH
MEAAIAAAGRIPVQRTTLYEILDSRAQESV